MWNRQREAEEAREKLARAGEDGGRAQPQSAAGRRRDHARPPLPLEAPADAAE